MKRLAGIAAALAFAGLAASAYASPIQLFTDQTTKLKFTNFENFVDANNNKIIDAGDSFYGILKVTSISDVNEVNTLNAPLVNNELTGIFKTTVVGPGTIPIGGAGHVDFALQAGDYIKLYVGTGATKNFSVGSGVATDIAHASDGVLWASVLPGTFYEGLNNTTTPPFPTVSENWNWADLTANNTGYAFAPTLWPESLGIAPLHTYLGVPHVTGHESDIFFQSHLFNTNATGWQFRSEDPIYLNAVPEPGTMLLLGSGLLGLAGFSRKRSKKA